MKHPSALPLLPLAACLGFIAPTGARAQDSTYPYYIGASETVTHDNNVLRSCSAGATDAGCPAVPVVADTISTTSLLAGFDREISRQRLRGDATVSANRYKNRSDLNNTGYHLLGDWDWATVGNLSGTLSALLNRQFVQNSLSDPTLALNGKNLETSREYAATGVLGGVTKLTFEAGITRREVDYSSTLWAIQEQRANVGSLGVKYRPSDALTFGVGARETRGYYNPSGPTIDYRRHDLDLTGTWVASGFSTLNARLSYGREIYDTAPDRNFSGATGSLQWLWKATGKTSFTTTLLRDTGSQAGFYTTGILQGTPVGTSLLTTTQAGNISRVMTQARLGVAYEATAKITATASVANAHRSLVSTLSTTPDSGSDDTTSGSLGVRWAPTRNITLGCDWSHEHRGVSLNPGSTLSYPYSDHIYSCMGQFLLR